MKKERTQGDKISKFGRGLLIYVAVLLVLLVIGLIIFWNFLRAYDASLPETALDGYLSALTQEEWKEMVASDAPYTTNGFESADVLYEKTASAISQAKISYTKNYEAYTDAAPAYFLIRDGKKFAELTLKQGEDVGFGFTAFAVERCHIMEEAVAVEPFSVMVLAPKAAEVTLNGITLDAQYITEAERESPEFSKYNNKTEDRPMCTVYTVDGFYAMPKAEASLNGTALHAEENGALYTFAYPEGTFQTLTVTAPSTALLLLNGFKLGDAPTSSVVLGSNPYEEGITERVAMHTYEIRGLYGDVETACYINGKPLDVTEANNSLSFTYPEELIYHAKIMAPTGAEVTVNGMPITADTEKTTAVYDAMDTRTIATWMNRFPMCDVYDIGACYMPPEVTATLDGAILEVSSEGTQAEYTVLVAYPTDTEVPTEIARAAEDFTRAFLYYTVRGYEQFYENMLAAQKFTVAGSDAYTSLFESRYGVYFNSCYELVYKSIDVLSVTHYTDECVSVTVEFDIEKTRYGETTRDDGRYLLTLVKLQNGTWSVAEFTMVAKP